MWETACNAKRDTGQSIDPTQVLVSQGYQVPMSEKENVYGLADGEEHEKASKVVVYHIKKVWSTQVKALCT